MNVGQRTRRASGAALAGPSAISPLYRAFIVLKRRSRATISEMAIFLVREGAPHFQHIRGWGVVVVLLSYCLSSPVTEVGCACVAREVSVERGGMRG